MWARFGIHKDKILTKFLSPGSNNWSDNIFETGVSHQHLWYVNKGSAVTMHNAPRKTLLPFLDRTPLFEERLNILHDLVLSIPLHGRCHSSGKIGTRQKKWHSSNEVKFLWLWPHSKRSVLCPLARIFWISNWHEPAFAVFVWNSFFSLRFQLRRTKVAKYSPPFQVSYSQLQFLGTIALFWWEKIWECKLSLKSYGLTSLGVEQLFWL